MCSLSVNALLRCFGKTSTLITISSLSGPAETGWYDKRCRASSSCKHVRLYKEHMPMFGLYAVTFIMLVCILPC